MEREILFKAVEEQNPPKKFVTGSLLILDSGCYIVAKDGTQTKVIPETVCQFTGLSTEKGDMIFEGDTVEAWSEGMHLQNGIIRFGQGPCCFFITNKTYSIHWHLSGNRDHKDDIIVTGNIHDHLIET